MKTNNDVTIRLNGFPIAEDHPKKILAEIFSSAAPELKYWSLDSINEFFDGSIEFMLGYCDLHQAVNGKNAIMTYFRRTAIKLQTLKPVDKDELIVFIYEVILQGEGFARLPGFGIATSTGGTPRGNPEVQSIHAKEAY